MGERTEDGLFSTSAVPGTCGGAEKIWTNLGLRLPLSVDQNLPGRPDVKTVELESRNQFLDSRGKKTENHQKFPGGRTSSLLQRPGWAELLTWQKCSALQGFPKESTSGENAMRPRTPGTAANRTPWPLDTAGTDVCNNSSNNSSNITWLQPIPKNHRGRCDLVVLSL